MCVLFVFTCIIILAHIEKKITPPRTENKHLIEVGLSVPLIKKTYAVLSICLGKVVTTFYPTCYLGREKILNNCLANLVFGILKRQQSFLYRRCFSVIFSDSNS